MKAAIIGGGNIGTALAEGLIRAEVCRASDITITRRKASALSPLEAKGFIAGTDNAAAIDDATVPCAYQPANEREIPRRRKTARQRSTARGVPSSGNRTAGKNGL